MPIGIRTMPPGNTPTTKPLNLHVQPTCRAAQLQNLTSAQLQSYFSQSAPLNLSLSPPLHVQSSWLPISEQVIYIINGTV